MRKKNIFPFCYVDIRILLPGMRKADRRKKWEKGVSDVFKKPQNFITFFSRLGIRSFPFLPPFHKTYKDKIVPREVEKCFFRERKGRIRKEKTLRLTINH